MIGIAWSAAARAGLAFNMPLDWYAMVALFFVMLAVFLHIRLRAVSSPRRGGRRGALARRRGGARKRSAGR